MFKVAPISTRRQIADVLNERGLVGTGVEIGTHRGEFARMLLDHWRGKFLHCVDPWRDDLPGYAEQAKLLWGGAPDRSFDRQETHLQLAGHVGRWADHRCTSAEALTMFNRGSLDFVYVDGDHRFAHALHDYRHWWWKLRPGGMLAGHDWAQPGEAHSWAGEIQDALQEFLWTAPESDPLQGGDLPRPDVFLIVEENGLPWSFYLFKPEVKS